MLECLKKSDTKLLIAGPCIIESLKESIKIVNEIKRVAELYGFHPIFKASYDKANRTSHSGFRGINLSDFIDIIAEIKESTEIEIVSDMHDAIAPKIFSDIVDFLQVPAFLCRQTDIIEACAKTSLPTIVKKGQFLSPESCRFIEEKFYMAGGSILYICERGTTFGYNDLVVDATSIARIRESCRISKVIMDCTHSLQIPNSVTGVTKGRSEYIETMVRFAAVSKADGMFLEVHPNPSKSPSDSENILKLDKLEGIIRKAKKIYECE